MKNDQVLVQGQVEKKEIPVKGSSISRGAGCRNVVSVRPASIRLAWIGRGIRE